MFFGLLGFWLNLFMFTLAVMFRGFICGGIMMFCWGFIMFCMDIIMFGEFIGLGCV